MFLWRRPPLWGTATKALNPIEGRSGSFGESGLAPRFPRLSYLFEGGAVPEEDFSFPFSWAVACAFGALDVATSSFFLGTLVTALLFFQNSHSQ